MLRTHAIGLAAAITLALLLPAWSSFAGARAAYTYPANAQAVLDRSDSLFRAGAPRPALGLLDSLQRAARARRDMRLDIAARLWRARGYNWATRFDSTDRLIREVMPDIRRTRDTLAWARAELTLGIAEDIRRRSPAAETHYRRAIDLSRRAKLHEEQGFGWVRLGYGNLQRGDARKALAAYSSALRVLRSGGSDGLRVTTLIGLGRCHSLLGDQGSARKAYQRALAIAERIADLPDVADATFNLGSIEYVFGDPAKSSAYFRRAFEVSRALGWSQRVVNAAAALAVLETSSGNFAQADSILGEALPLALRTPDFDARAQVLCGLSVLRGLQGQRNESIAYARRAHAFIDSISAVPAANVVEILAQALAAAGRPQSAVALVDSMLARPGARTSLVTNLELRANRAVQLRVMGRTIEAASELRAVLAGLPENGGDEVMLWTVELARAYRALGAPDSALSRYARAAAAWESVRARSRTPEWREVYDEAAGNFAPEYAAALLDPARGGSAEARAERAFDALQHFRARTLAERLGLTGRSAATVGAAALRARSLRPGELLLDLYPGPDTTIVFALSRNTIRAYGVPRESQWLPRFVRLRALMEEPTAVPAEAIATTARELGGLLFGPVADLVQGSSPLLVAAGGAAHLPIAALVVPGESDVLIARREVVSIASSTMLVEARVRAAAGKPGTNRVLAVSRTHDDEGRPLPGARAETQALVDAYEGVTRRTDAPTLAPILAEARDHDVLHFATHTRPGARSPWRQALLIGPPERDGAWLEAGVVARQRFRARLCVLSACETMGARRVSFESLRGLAPAWLAAGVPTVVATQWSVDDDATRELMRRFYRGLASGRTASAALRAAQLELRADPRWSHPYYWAGVTLLGEPNTRVGLQPRRRARGLPSTRPPGAGGRH